jgi:ParB family chromosome partitioning protein
VTLADLQEIAKCGSPADRYDICRELASGNAKSAAEVLKRKKAPGAAVVDPAEKALGKLLDAWQRAPKEARRRFAASRAEELSELLGWAADAHPAPEAATGGDVVQLNTAREA